jgi:hypothetical protein
VHDKLKVNKGIYPLAWCNPSAHAQGAKAPLLKRLSETFAKNLYGKFGNVVALWIKGIHRVTL